MQKIFFYTFLLLLCPVFLCPAIYGQQDDFNETSNRTERIINFHSDIVIDTTGMIRVTETIKVFSNGKDIKRGIVRSIPVYRTDKFDKKQKMTIDIVSVSCNGKREDYKIENVGEYKEVYIGNAKVYLKPGIYEYVIVYKSPGQVGFFDEFDELYWNVTGNEWEFYIEQASASITLPDDAQSLSVSCYTGFLRSTAMNCSSEEAGNKVHFKTDGRLVVREGFTVAVSFPRDIIKRPLPPTVSDSPSPTRSDSYTSALYSYSSYSPSRFERFWDDSKLPVSTLLCLSIFGIFFYLTWRKVGKNPEKPVVIPTFNPPHDRTPAATRYLYKRKYDIKVFASALVGMAVKKAIRISKKKKQYTLESIEKTENLSEEENKIYDALFTDNKSITVTNKNYAKFSKANLNLTSTLKGNWNLEDYFLNNTKYIVVGLLLALALIVLHVILNGDMMPEVALWNMVSLIGLAVMSMTVKYGKNNFVNTLKILGFFILGVSALFAFLVVLEEIVDVLGENWTLGLMLVVLYVLYIFLIKAPTKLGAQTAAELKGFKMYLQTAEEYRLNILTPPEKTPELFEKLLPYAIALGVENKWGKKFSNVLKQFNYEPDWYNGDKPFSSSDISSTFARSFVSSVGSARTDPDSSSSGGSWSSGSSGGGSSGGGGGGGGGRGW